CLMSRPAVAPEVIVAGPESVIAAGPGFQIIDEHVLDTGLVESLIDIADEADPPMIVLDLSHTRFFGSSFIEVLFRVWTRLQGRAGGTFVICGLTPHCLDVLKITHLDTLWRLFAPPGQALQAPSPAAGPKTLRPGQRK